MLLNTEKFLSKKDFACKMQVIELERPAKEFEKKIFAFRDGTVEACRLYLPNRSIPNVVCVSTQLGCPYSCSICANGNRPFKRNLSLKEIMGQVKFFAENSLFLNYKKFDITLMGIGEPLANLNNVIDFVEEAHSQFNLNKVNISTIGLTKGIRNLASSKLRNKIHLQVSLHAAFDKKRKGILDSKVESISDILRASEIFANRMNDKVCFNYVLIKGINDSLCDIKKLIDLTRSIKCYIKLSELNHIRNMNYKASTEATTHKIKSFLENNGIEVHLFKSVGRGINIGCGQFAAFTEDVLYGLKEQYK